MKKISNEFGQAELTIVIFWVIFAAKALKLEKVAPTFSSFNPCQSLPSVAKEDKKQFQCLTKLSHYF